MGPVAGTDCVLLLERPAGPAAVSSSVSACCSAVYGHPLAEALMGESFHPGGLARTRELLAASKLPVGSRILDVGCGLGASARVAAADFGLTVDAIDVSAIVLEEARARPEASGSRNAGGDSSHERITWQRGDATDLPMAGGTYDAVLAECVLAAVPRERAMAEIARVLRPDGVLLLSDVEISGEPIEGFEPGGVLGTALCVSSAWMPGEFDARLDAVALDATRRWDHSEDILRLIERIEGRLMVARSLQSGDSRSGRGKETVVLPDPVAVRAITDSARAAVEEGRLGYFAAIARRR